jgi:periplasmic copper chaperone A
VAMRSAVMLAVAAFLLVGCAAGDPDVRVVGEPQASVPVAGSSQIVITIANDGNGKDELVGASTPAALGVEIHVSEIEEGRATMRELDAVEIRAGERVRFRPGALHLMLVVPDETVVEGGTFDLTLHFDRSEDLTVPVEVVDLLDLADDAFDDDP